MIPGVLDIDSQVRSRSAAFNTRASFFEVRREFAQSFDIRRLGRTADSERAWHDRVKHAPFMLRVDAFTSATTSTPFVRLPEEFEYVRRLAELDKKRAEGVGGSDNVCRDLVHLRYPLLPYQWPKSPEGFSMRPPGGAGELLFEGRVADDSQAALEEALRAAGGTAASR